MALSVIVNPPASTDSNGDGMTDAEAAANGLDPNAVNGDSDGDGVPDALEIGDPDNAAGGGGGCVLRTDLRRERYDFMLIILILMAGISARTARRRRIKSPQPLPYRADGCGKTEKEARTTETA
jgi:hypothetical protein